MSKAHPDEAKTKEEKKMKNTEKEKVYGMIYHEEPKNIYSDWDCYGHWTIRLVKVEDGKVRNFPSSWGGHKFDNLTLRGQYHVKEKIVSEIYGAQIGYKDKDVTIQNVEIMAKTLKGIEKKIEKIKESYGSPRNFGRYAVYFLRAIGAKGWKMITPGTGWSYDECDFITGSVGEIENFIEVEMNKYTAKLEIKEVV